MGRCPLPYVCNHERYNHQTPKSHLQRSNRLKINKRPGKYAHVEVSITNRLHHDDVIKGKHFPCNWPFVRGIQRSPVNSPHKGQWGGALMFSLICAWINAWVNNREAGDLGRRRAHYDVIVMTIDGLRLVCLNRVSDGEPLISHITVEYYEKNTPNGFLSLQIFLIKALFVRVHSLNHISVSFHQNLKKNEPRDTSVVREETLLMLYTYVVQLAGYRCCTHDDSICAEWLLGSLLSPFL